jgi:DNA-directed RNA polymerase specialized sigma24 family protein
MLDPGSITRMFLALERGESRAAQGLWDQYFHRLVEVARNKLGAAPRGMADAEDAALSALGSFFRRAEQGSYAAMRNRDELWRLLVVITRCKACNQVRHEVAKIRGGGNVAGDAELSHVLGGEVPPDFVPELADELSHLFDLLRNEQDDDLMRIARLKAEGHDNLEIAHALGRSKRTVERKFKLICVLAAHDAEKRNSANGKPESPASVSLPDGRR